MVHDGDPLREAGDDLHVVLDHQHRLALLARARSGSARRARRRPPSRRRPSARRAGSRAGRRRAASRARACACRRARASPAVTRAATAEPDALERPARALDRLADARRAPPDPHRAAERRLGRQPHVLEHGRAAGRRSRPGTSARAPRACAGTAGVPVMSTPSSSTRAGRRPEQARDEVEQRRLAGPVRADHGEQFALADLEPDIGDDRCAADDEPEVPRCEDRGCAHALVRR